MLEVQSLASLDFKESDEDFMMTFGSYVAMAIENQMQIEPEVAMLEHDIQELVPAKNTKKINVTYYVEDECI